MVDVSQAGERLDSFLSALLPDITRSRIQRSIREDLVSIDGIPAWKTGIRLKEGQEIVFQPPSVRALTATPEHLPLDILFEDEHLLVVNKVAGMVVHPAPGHPGGTLVNAVLGRYPEMCTGGSLRPGIVHRLDRGTSGAMVVARSETARTGLSEQFLERTIFKGYLAFCFGSPATVEGTVEQPIDRHPRERKRFTSLSGQGRPSQTRWRTLVSGRGFSLMAIRILTGRTHQIRVHLADVGHAVVGDDLYCPGWRRRTDDLALHATRRGLWISDFVSTGPDIDASIRGGSGKELAAACRHGPLLHAAVLGFTHPVTREPMVIHAPLPPAMNAAAQWLARGLAQPVAEAAAHETTFKIGG